MLNTVKIKVFNTMIYNNEVVNSGDEIDVDVNFGRYIVGMKQAKYIKEKIIIIENTEEKEELKEEKEVVLNNKEEVFENKNIETKTTTTRKGKK